jgi:hypothetical protein
MADLRCGAAELTVAATNTNCFSQEEKKNMLWLKPNLRNSINGLLGNPLAPSDSVLENGTEDVREAMLDVMGEAGQKSFPNVARRIRFASDIQALWYLRGDLMAALAALHSESVARDKIAAISRRFNGLLPNGLNSRPSPLVG